MTHQERDRLGLSVVLALAAHAVIIVMLTLIDWQVHDYPESRTVFIDLLEYQTAPPVIESIPEPIEEPVVTPEVVEVPPAEIAAQVPAPPIAPDPNPAPRAPAPAQPQVSPIPAAPVPPVSRDAPPGSFSFADDPMLRSDPTVDRSYLRTPDAELFGDVEVSETGQLPAWVDEGIIQPLGTLAPVDQEGLADKRATVAGFDALLDRVLQSLTSPSTTSNANAQPGTPGDGVSRENTLPGDPRLEWVGGGTRRPIGTLAMPDLASGDFGGLVPARVSWVIVFDVDADGLVVPGSLILRNSSGYTSADQKVRRALASWQFELAPGSQPVTVICTLILERDDLR